MLSVSFASISALLAAPSPQVAVLIEHEGVSAGDRYGRASFIGDVDRDGYGDFAVGAYLEDNANGTNAGAAYVYSGRDGALLVRWLGDTTNDTFGTIVKNVGDQDADGYDEIAVSATSDQHSGFNNYVRIFSGRFLFDGTGSQVLRTITASMTGDFGSDLDRAGDVDGDGFDDLLVGDTDRDPGAHVYSGQTGAELFAVAAPNATLFGVAVAGFRDVDGDGFPEFLVGDPTTPKSGNADVGSVTLFRGGPPGTIGGVLATFDGDALEDRFGLEIELADDLDGDGVVDFAVGAPGSPDRGTSPGFVRFFSGAKLGELGVLCGRNGGEFFGTEIAVADLDGDGALEIAIAARNADVNGLGNVGRVDVFSATDGSQLFELTGWKAGDKVARLGAGDLDGDGVSELLLASGHINRKGKKDLGAAWVAGPIDRIARSSHYGTGHAGTLGVPLITVTKEAALGKDAQITLDNSSGAATIGVLLVGVSSADVATGRGGRLLVDPALFVPVVFLGANAVTMTARIPMDTALAGLPLYLQGLEIDAGASAGISFTDGVELIAGGVAW